MDFMHDVLADGTKIRLLTIVDTFAARASRSRLICTSNRGQVVEVLRRLAGERGKPDRIHCDNGPEFVSLQLDQ